MARALGICHTVAGALPVDSGHIGVHLHLDTTLLHALHNHIASLFIKAAQYRLAPIPKMGLHPKSIENSGKFTRNITASHDQYPLGQSFQMKNLIRGDGIFGSGNIGHRGPAARGQQNHLGRDDPAIGQTHRMRTVDCRAHVEGLNSRVVQQAAINAFQPIELTFQIAPKSRPVETAHPHVPAIGGSLLDSRRIG